MKFLDSAIVKQDVESHDLIPTETDRDAERQRQMMPQNVQHNSASEMLPQKSGNDCAKRMKRRSQNNNGGSSELNKGYPVTKPTRQRFYREYRTVGCSE